MRARMLGGVAAVLLAACGTGPTPLPTPSPVAVGSPAPSSSSPATPTPIATAEGGIPPCTGEQLGLEVHPNGATGSVFLGVIARNGISDPCVLHGAPAEIELLAGDRPLATTYVAHHAIIGADESLAAPVAILQPNTFADAGVVWSNWCGPRPRIEAIRVVPPGGGPAALAAVQPFDPPRCDVDDAPSTLDGYAFDPEATR